MSPRSRSLPAPWGGPRDTFGIVFSPLVREAQGILKTENTCAGLITERVVMPISLVLITFPRLGAPLSSQDLFPVPAQHGGGKGRRIPGLSWNTRVRRRRHLPPRVDRWRPAWRSTGRCTQTPPVGIREAEFPPRDKPSAGELRMRAFGASVITSECVLLNSN